MIYGNYNIAVLFRMKRKRLQLLVSRQTAKLDLLSLILFLTRVLTPLKKCLKTFLSFHKSLKCHVPKTKIYHFTMK